MGADPLQALSNLVAHCSLTERMDFGDAGVAVNVLF
jgi:hypothetical protein